MMHVVATNSSPRMEKGNTVLIMNPFLEGMKEAGTQVELVYSKKLSIQPCTGEFSCWGATPYPASSSQQTRVAHKTTLCYFFLALPTAFTLRKLVVSSSPRTTLHGQYCQPPTDKTF